MCTQTALIKILLDNKDKILNAKKYSKYEFTRFINSLNKAETQRQTILHRIKAMGYIDIEKLKKEIQITERDLILNIEYLKELGLLEFVGEVSEFYNGIEDKNEIKGLFPNISTIRDKKICSGCGLCVSICPINAIKFLDDVLSIDEDLCIQCGLCYACCHRSFFPDELKINQKKYVRDLNYTKGLRHFKDVYTAQTKIEDIIQVAQDGGIITTLFKVAFEENLIDHALLVKELTNGSSFKPLPALVDNEIELLKTGGTKYSNAHALKILYKARNFKKVGIAGTSCVLQALQKISFYPLNKPFYDNIIYKIGIFCMESFDYDKLIEILKKEFHKNPEEIKKMDINNGHFIIYDKNGDYSEIPIKNIKKYGPYGCFLCDDLCGEFCDLSVGSIGSEERWSTVIIRNKKGADLFQKLVDRDLINNKRLESIQNAFKLINRLAKSKIKMYKEIPRQKMIEQDPNIRRKNFEEVPKEFSIENVELEVQRCLQCANPLCVEGCPVKIKIPDFINLLKKKRFDEASVFIRQYNLLPAICGRVCPQEIQCEGKCLLGKINKPVAIGNLERFIADWSIANNSIVETTHDVSKNLKVAIVGSGPAGLTCAGELVKYGYDVTVFEALHTGGGVLTYGIPEFRLPKVIVQQEIENLKKLGVKFEFNIIIGKSLKIDDLKNLGFKAIFIGVGAGLPIFLKIPGMNLKGVLSANEFLTRANLMKAYKFPEYDTPIKIGKIVAVIGGGNVAMDSARVALRLGAEKVILVYRRSEKEMPARREEYHHAKEEGIEFLFLTNPIKFIGDKDGDVHQMEVKKMRLGVPDDSGRQRPIPIENSEYKMIVDTVIIAIGTRSNPICPRSIVGLNLDNKGYIITNEYFQSSIENIFAGGDIVTGSATVISAMGAGKEAAEAIDKFLMKNYKFVSSTAAQKIRS